MASIERTAYPRFGARLTDKELEADYALSDEETLFVRRHARGDSGRLSLAVLLKTRQWLGYFVALSDVPNQIRLHIAGALSLAEQTALADEVGRPATVHRYRDAIRERLGSRPFSHGGRPIVIGTVHRAAQTMSDPADLVSASVEALAKERVELPAYNTLNRLVGSLRQEIHEELYASIDGALNDLHRGVLDALLDQPAGAQLNTFSQLKQNPGPPTLKHLRQWIDRLAELDAILDPRPLLADIPHTKIRQFAAEATALETGDLRDVCRPGRRHTLLLCLLHQTQTETRDQLVEMFIRRMRRTRNRAVDRLRAMQANQRQTEETLLGVFGQVLHHAGADGDDQNLGRNIRQLLAEQGGVEALGAQFHAVTAFHNDNYLPLLWPIHSSHRSALFRLLDLLTLESSTRDTRLLEALDVVRQNQRSRRESLSVSLDLGFASQRWQSFVRKRENGEILLGRHGLELCVFMYLAEALQSGDLYIVGSGAYDDYRAQLLPWEECDRRLDDYGAAVGLPTDASGFVAELRDKLAKLAKEVDAGFPDNSALTIDPDGTPHLIRQPARHLPDGLYAFEEAIRARMPERHLLDVLKHTQHWSSFTRHFGPLSGSAPKLDDATKRYLFAVFGLGCNLGVSQTARHAPESINRHSLRRINAQHVNV
ncbi:MAG: Tn3 family transposase, partial [bacterium]|nr:Tn3 family transposase [bacterium]